MRRIILLVIVLGVMVNYSYAQADAHFSLFEYSQNAFNPGAAGSSDAMCVTSTHRQQWVGYGQHKGEGRPITTLFSFDMPINKINSGIGMGITQDIIGFQKDLHIKLNYAYRADLGFGVLGAGIGLGIINRVIDPDWKTSNSIGGSSVYLDPTLPHMESVNAFDLNLGATLFGNNYWFGIAVTHLTKPKINFNVEIPSYLTQHIYILGGYSYSIPSSPHLDLLASGIIQADRVSKAEFQINLKLLYQKRFWGGVSYRFTEAIVPMVGLHLLNGISVAYSYDIGLSGIGSYGSHELMLRYCFDVSKDKSLTRSKSVRRL